jgi:L-2-hydroxyglutarate oxidase LhgO
MDSVDCVVIGAGVVGLAIARELSLAGHEVIIVEAQNAIGSVTSARNSEVIHAGIYYAQGSLKARLCVEGRKLLYGYCAEHHIPHARCGKLIVATDAAQHARLDDVGRRASNNGVHDLRRIDRTEAQALEPQLQCSAALLSPSTGIVDSHALMQQLLADAENAGAILALQSEVSAARFEAAGMWLEVTTADGQQSHLRAKTRDQRSRIGCNTNRPPHRRLAWADNTDPIFCEGQLLFTERKIAILATDLSATGSRWARRAFNNRPRRTSALWP